MDELELDLEQDTQEINKTQQRINNLSSKVRDTAKERDDAKAAADAAEAARLAAEKERDFYAAFSDSATKYPAASEHRDAIKEKVLAGYSVEDATVAVLNAENKLIPQVEKVEAPGPAAGGSAANINFADASTKPLHEMSRDEKRQAIIDAEKRGDISLT